MNFRRLPLTEQKLEKRFFAYGLYLLLIAGFALSELIEHEKPDLRFWFLEGGFVENTQLTHFIFAALLFGWSALLAFRASMESRWVYTAFCVGMVWCAHRELDGFWSSVEMKGVFSAVRAALTCTLILLGVLNISSCWRVFQKHARSWYMIGLYLGSGGYLAAQILGGTLRDVGVSRLTKRSFEESLELFFGSFFLFSALELLLLTRRELRSSEAPLEERDLFSGTPADTGSTSKP